jgi:hypothetical protein
MLGVRSGFSHKYINNITNASVRLEQRPATMEFIFYTTKYVFIRIFLYGKQIIVPQSRVCRRILSQLAYIYNNYTENKRKWRCGVAIPTRQLC